MILSWFCIYQICNIDTDVYLWEACEGLGLYCREVNEKQNKVVETEQYAPTILLCYCPK